MPELATRIPSRICLPFKNADLDSEITPPMTRYNLLANNWVRTLYKLPTKEMGLKSFNFWGQSI